ncbi:hypothetical protein ACHRVY_19720 [Flavobacterium plurextorum]|uniref:hypothetical protein n=1 Tax=Flavobacterium plurextorum TaxID=1114867 RepID=UPI003757F2F0
MEKLIAIITVLFILSMVCERIAEFLKYYISDTKFGKRFIVGNTSRRYPKGSKGEQDRMYRILKINLVCGFLTAVSCHASLFDLLSNLDNPGAQLGWAGHTEQFFQWECFLENVGFVLGCFMTGAFISLGSKFWHDLLDIVMAVRDAKNDVNRSADSRFTGLTQSEKYQLLDAAINENKASWKAAYANYAGVSIGNKLIGSEKTDTGELAIRFNVVNKVSLAQDARVAIPDYIYYAGYKIPTDVIETGDIVASVTPIGPKVMPRPLGSSIERVNSGYAGTLGLRAKVNVNGNVVLCGMSCYHVLFPEELKKGVREVFSPDDSKILNSHGVVSPAMLDLNNTMQRGIGNVVTGYFNSYVDIGFFETTRELAAKDIYSFKPIKSIYELTLNDVNTLKVKLCGRTSVVVQGKVVSVRTDNDIIYFKGTSKQFKHEIQDLIQVEVQAAAGDSGSAVVTIEDELLGILVATDNHYAYIIPMHAVTKNFDVEFEF